jgi:tetratricopeptide (TPR) repeat protein
MMVARREILFSSGASEGAKTDINPAGAKRDGGGGLATVKASSDSGARKPSGIKSGGGGRAAASLRPLSVDQETYDLLQRARAAREGGRSEDAVTFYRRVLSRNNSFFPPANLELSFVLSALKRHAEAAETLAVVAKREGARYPIAYYHLGREYEVLGRLGLAAEAFEKAASAHGDSAPQFYLDLSRVREKEGNAQAALEAMETYVRISQSLGHTPDWSTARLIELRQKAGKK